MHTTPRRLTCNPIPPLQPTHALHHKQEKYLSFVEDRAFNDLRYTVNSEALKRLGWKEQVRVYGHMHACMHACWWSGWRAIWGGWRVHGR